MTKNRNHRLVEIRHRFEDIRQQKLIIYISEQKRQQFREENQINKFEKDCDKADLYRLGLVAFIELI